MNIDFSLPKQKWTLSHIKYQNETERLLIQWAKEVVKEQIMNVSSVQTYLQNALNERAKTHKSRRTNKNIIKIEFTEDYKSVIVTVPRFTVNSDKQITDEFNITLLKLTKHESKTKE
jgi:hypothetical protein